MASAVAPERPSQRQPEQRGQPEVAAGQLAALRDVARGQHRQAEVAEGLGVEPDEDRVLVLPEAGRTERAQHHQREPEVDDLVEQLRGDRDGGVARDPPDGVVSRES